MRFIRILTLVVAVAAESAVAAGDVVALLPKGATTADVMTLAPSARFQELTIRFREAVSRDPGWFKAFAAKAPAGQPLPYDEKLGISEQEYGELQALSKTQKLTKIQEATVTFGKRPDGSIVVQAPDLNDLDGVKISADSAAVTTSYGTLTSKTTIDNSDASSPTGAWSGTQWSGERIDGAMTNGYTAKLALGQLKESGRMILYFSGKALADAKLSRRTDLTLFFDGRK